jgi:lambda family phage portal protein
MLGSLGMKHASLNFDAASTEGRHADWSAVTPRAVDSLTRRQGDRLRARSVDMARNDILAATALRKLSMAIAGVRPRAGTNDPVLNRDIDQLWDEWEKEASTSGYLTFSGLMWQLIGGMLGGGGAILRARARRIEDGLTVPLQLETLDIGHIATHLTQRTERGGRITQGIEFDSIGRLLAYHLWRELPNGDFADGRIVRVPEQVLAHVFVPQEIGQTRGIPFATPALVNIRDLQVLGDAQRTRAIGESAFMGVVTTSGDEDGAGITGNPDDEGNTNDDDEVLEHFIPGTWTYLKAGQDVKIHSPVGTTFDALKRDEVGKVAAALGVTYEQLTADLSRTNWTSYKAGQIDHRALVRFIQREIVVPMAMRRVYVWFIDAGVAAGLIPRAAMSSERTIRGGGSYRVNYPMRSVYPPFSEVDRAAEAKATNLQLRNGLTDIERVWEEEGHDPSVVWDRLQRQNEEAKKRGIVLDCLPSMTTSSGQTQQSPADPERNSAP